MHIELSEDEALVLFEWLANLDGSTEKTKVPAPERYALLRLEGQLEKSLVVTLRSGYADLVEQARARLLVLAGGEDLDLPR